jgi:hypothetical protein
MAYRWVDSLAASTVVPRAGLLDRRWVAQMAVSTAEQSAEETAAMKADWLGEQMVDQWELSSAA